MRDLLDVAHRIDLLMVESTKVTDAINELRQLETQVSEDDTLDDRDRKSMLKAIASEITCIEVCIEVAEAKRKEGRSGRFVRQTIELSQLDMGRDRY